MGEEQPKRNDIEIKVVTKNKPINYVAYFSEEFDHFYNHVFSTEKLNLIDDFLDHYEKNGLRNWKGKICSSANVPSSYSDHIERSNYAKQYDLWHVHIGLPSWQSYENVPYLTSDQVLHFQKHNNYEITLLTVSTHNPMDLPPLEMLE
ncbi:hypothetical protein [Acinetobacter pittii]|uniref:hypothetical protein n=1 Tax=Acinetobacter pittii TaxID=48296 RepID=UPI0024DE6BB0|nr:hypothetical protein [Acinetobacter pittii]